MKQGPKRHLWLLLFIAECNIDNKAATLLKVPITFASLKQLI